MQMQLRTISKIASSIDMSAFGNATTFLLLVGAAFFPLLLTYYQQQGGQEQEHPNENSIEDSVAKVVDVVRKVRRRLERGEEEVLDDDNLQQPKRRRSSRFKHDRARLAIQEDYFSPTPIFDDKQFERVFRITKTMTEQIMQLCARTDTFFTEIEDVSCRYGIAPVAKVLVALKQIAYGCSPSAFLDYFQMGEGTARQSLLSLCRIVSEDNELASVFLRSMTRADARRISSMHELLHGVPGMLGSLDCMHIYWKNCPVAWQGSQTGKSKKPSIVLEAFADYNLWFWHHSFGWPGSMNDINIWDRSCLLKCFLDGSFASDVDFEFEIGTKTFSRLWLLVDGIYPELSRFVKTIQEPVGRKSTSYALWQESARKDIERAFGVLQRTFHILVRKMEFWYLSDICNVVNTCIVLHNMMVAHRIDSSDDESDAIYLHDDINFMDDDVRRVGQEAEQEHVNRRVAEMELHRQLYGVNTEQRQRRRNDDVVNAHVLDSLKFQYLQRRWECLYDADEHHRLRSAIMEEIGQSR
jgi:hypothetical protein